MSEDSRIFGDLVSAAPVHCDAVVEGNVRGAGHVHIGPSAIIAGDVRATSVRVEGIVKGDVLARDRVAIGMSGRVQGSVRARSLDIDPAGRVEGSQTIDLSGRLPCRPPSRGHEFGLRPEAPHASEPAACPATNLANAETKTHGPLVPTSTPSGGLRTSEQNNLQSGTIVASTTA